MLPHGPNPFTYVPKSTSSHKRVRFNVPRSSVGTTRSASKGQFQNVTQDTQLRGQGKKTPVSISAEVERLLAKIPKSHFKMLEGKGCVLKGGSAKRKRDDDGYSGSDESQEESKEEGDLQETKEDIPSFYMASDEDKENKRPRNEESDDESILDLTQYQIPDEEIDDFANAVAENVARRRGPDELREDAERAHAARLEQEENFLKTAFLLADSLRDDRDRASTEEEKARIQQQLDDLEDRIEPRLLRRYYREWGYASTDDNESDPDDPNWREQRNAIRDRHIALAQRSDDSANESQDAGQWQWGDDPDDVRDFADWLWSEGANAPWRGSGKRKPASSSSEYVASDYEVSEESPPKKKAKPRPKATQQELNKAFYMQEPDRVKRFQSWRAENSRRAAENVRRRLKGQPELERISPPVTSSSPSDSATDSDNASSLKPARGVKVRDATQQGTIQSSHPRRDGRPGRMYKVLFEDGSIEYFSETQIRVLIRNEARGEAVAAPPSDSESSDVSMAVSEAQSEPAAAAEERDVLATPITRRLRHPRTPANQGISRSSVWSENSSADNSPASAFGDTAAYANSDEPSPIPYQPQGAAEFEEWVDNDGNPVPRYRPGTLYHGPRQFNGDTSATTAGESSDASLNDHMAYLWGDQSLETNPEFHFKGKGRRRPAYFSYGRRNRGKRGVPM